MCLSDGQRLCVCIFLTTMASALSACVQTPPLHSIPNSDNPDPRYPGSISINEVVKRVKCEIRDAVANRPENRYKWFDKWTVQADLTLAVNDSSGVSPGAVFTQPLKPVTNTFALGLGAGATTTAARTEIVSFSMSVKEIRKEFFNKDGSVNTNAALFYNDCQVYGLVPIGLTGNLGLREWVDSAFGPVDTKVGPLPGDTLLREGNHKPPKGPSGAGATTSTQKAQAAASQSFKSLLDNYKQKLDALRAAAAISTDLSQKLVLLFDRFQAIRLLTGVLEQTQAKSLSALRDQILAGAEEIGDLKEGHDKDQITKIKGLFDKVAKDTEKWQDSRLDKSRWQPLLSAALRTAITDLEKLVTSEVGPALAQLQLICDCEDTTESSDTTVRLLADLTKCLKTLQTLIQADLPPTPAPKDPPIDAISHQVQFSIALTGSVNPTWTFVKFKGPSPATGSFATAGDTNTNTLTIVMGEPTSAATINSRSSLTLSAALANQLIPPLQQGGIPTIVP
jgi:hypothetical protein